MRGVTSPLGSKIPSDKIRVGRLELLLSLLRCEELFEDEEEEAAAAPVLPFPREPPATPLMAYIGGIIFRSRTCVCGVD